MLEGKVVRASETELKDRLVSVNRVTKVTKGGRTFGFAAIVVVGNENGVVGHGLGKSKEVAEAVTKAIEDAKKSLVRVPIHRGTIPHEIAGKFGGARVFLKPASLGTGVIAGGAMRAVLESAGVRDVLAKSKGSSNPHNVVKATVQALAALRTPQEIARIRGIQLDKVFNG
jgi:small subunit ribosomal protein S5